jgi:hypothetical protein
MAKVTSGWKGGRTPQVLGRRISERAQVLKSSAIDALEMSIEEGAILTQDFLEDAVTPTGREREERGGFPGRHDTGNMVGSISYEVRDRKAKRTWGVFGWWGANFERYFREQDEPGFGPGNIPPAKALPRAYVIARERLRERLEGIMYRGESPR